MGFKGNTSMENSLRDSYVCNSILCLLTTYFHHLFPSKLFFCVWVQQNGYPWEFSQNCALRGEEGQGLYFTHQDSGLYYSLPLRVDLQDNQLHHAKEMDRHRTDVFFSCLHYSPCHKQSMRTTVPMLQLGAPALKVISLKPFSLLYAQRRISTIFVMSPFGMICKQLKDRFWLN